jgi:hypothetical protein
MWRIFITFGKTMWPTITMQSIFWKKMASNSQIFRHFFFNCQISPIGYITCSHINEGFLKKSTMSSLVEPWQNIGIYDCQLSKIEKLKNKIKIINPNTMASLRKSFKKSYG